jgi:hypothetical protein
MPTARANLDTNQYVRVTSDPAVPSSVMLQSHRDTVRIVFSDVKPAKGNSVFHELGGEHSVLNVAMTELGVWALATTDRSALTVTEQRVPVEISERGTIGGAVFVQDQTTPVLTVPFLQTRAAVTLTADTVIDDRTIELTAGHGTLFGEVIELAETGTTKFMQADVIDPLGLAAEGDPVVGDTITLDQPVNRIYTTVGSIAQRSTKNLLVDGSVTPQIFSILPLPGQSGDMVRIIWEMRGAAGGSMDYTTFGSGPPLLNGCVIRIKNSDGTFRNLFNFKSNGDIIEQAFDLVFLDPKGGNTIPGMTARLTWGGQSKHGVVIRLDGTLGEELQIVAQDDLTTPNTRFHLTAQGHELQEV